MLYSDMVRRQYYIPEIWSYDSILETYKRLSISYKIKEPAEFKNTFQQSRYLLKEIAKRIKNNDQAAIEISIKFVTSTAYFSCSGFAKQAMCRSLKSAKLNENQKDSLRTGLLSIFEHSEYSHEYISYIKLLKRIGLAETEKKYISILKNKKDIVLKDLGLTSNK